MNFSLQYKHSAFVFELFLCAEVGAVPLVLGVGPCSSVVDRIFFDFLEGGSLSLLRFF